MSVSISTGTVIFNIKELVAVLNEDFLQLCAERDLITDAVKAMRAVQMRHADLLMPCIVCLPSWIRSMLYDVLARVICLDQQPQSFLLHMHACSLSVQKGGCRLWDIAHLVRSFRNVVGTEISSILSLSSILDGTIERSCAVAFLIEIVDVLSIVEIQEVFPSLSIIIVSSTIEMATNEANKADAFDMMTLLLHRLKEQLGNSALMITCLMDEFDKSLSASADTATRVTASELFRHVISAIDADVFSVYGKLVAMTLRGVGDHDRNVRQSCVASLRWLVSKAGLGKRYLHQEKGSSDGAVLQLLSGHSIGNVREDRRLCEKLSTVSNVVWSCSCSKVLPLTATYIR
jgi:hypothetical protein